MCLLGILFQGKHTRLQSEFTFTISLICWILSCTKAGKNFKQEPKLKETLSCRNFSCYIWQSLGLRREEQKNLAKGYLQEGLNLGPLVVYSDAFLTELTWQVLLKGYLTLHLFGHQLTFRLNLNQQSMTQSYKHCQVSSVSKAIEQKISGTGINPH